MHIKRFKGKQLPAVVRQVREELGPEAVILHTKTSRSRGLLRFLHGTAVEVMAAVDDSTAPPPRLLSARPAGPRAAMTSPPSRDTFAAEVTELRNLLIRLAGAYALAPALAPLYARLVDNGVDARLAFQILEATPLIDGEGRASAEALGRAVEERATALLRDGGARNTPAPGIVAFVGPTGVGKTTTLSKLAARGRLAGLITDIVSLDGVSLGAAGHLEALSAILGVRATLALTPTEVAAAIGRGGGRGLVLLDTPGLGPRDHAGIASLATLLAPARPTEVHLVLSATTKIDDARAAAQAFAALGITHLLLTKLDETTTYGSLLTVSAEMHLPLSYLAMGREVPNDIRPATAQDLARLAVRGDHEP